MQGFWWEHESLVADEAGLWMDGIPLAHLAHQYGTPLYLYSRATLQRQLKRLQAVLDQVSPRSLIYYAMKANRHPQVLQAVRALGTIGIDACSPREVMMALSHGFTAPEISFNAGMLSDQDLTYLAQGNVHCTFDSFSALRRYGARVARGTPVGLRFDPGVTVSYRDDAKLAYSQSKLGFELDEAQAALAAATQAGLVVDQVHLHIGWGLAEGQAGLVEQAFRQLAGLAQRLPDLAVINVGGGLGGRYHVDDEPLHLSTWGQLLRRYFAPLDVTIACEPGTFVAAPAGVLLVEVNTVEQRRGRHWLGVNAGFALNPCPVFYGIPLAVVPVARPLAPSIHCYHIAGHLNEAGDLWAQHQALPEMREGELLALLPAGAYGASMASDHCLRGDVTELMV